MNYNFLSPTQLEKSTCAPLWLLFITVPQLGENLFKWGGSWSTCGGRAEAAPTTQSHRRTQGRAAAAAAAAAHTRERQKKKKKKKKKGEKEEKRAAQQWLCSRSAYTIFHHYGGRRKKHSTIDLPLCFLFSLCPSLAHSGVDSCFYFSLFFFYFSVELCKCASITRLFFSSRNGSRRWRKKHERTGGAQWRVGGEGGGCGGHNI